MRALAAIVSLVIGCGRGDKPPAPPPPPPDPLAAFSLPEVASAGTVAWDAGAPIVVATPRAISVEGAQVVTLRDGVVDPADKEGGVLGIKISKLVARLGSLGAQTSAPLALALDRTLTYRLFVGIVFSAKQKEAGWKRFAVLVRAGGKPAAFPITLPDKRPATASAPGAGGGLAADIAALTEGDRGVEIGRAGRAPDRDRPLGLIVTRSKQDLLLWSFTGQEGTLQEPKLRVPVSDRTATQQLSAALAEIVRRRWSGGARPEGSHEIALMADGDTPMQIVAELIGAMRETPDGKPLFRDILLSAGFE